MKRRSDVINVGAMGINKGSVEMNGKTDGRNDLSVGRKDK